MKNNFSQIHNLHRANREELIDQVQKKYNQKFKNKPEYISLTPGRINIIGEHTDYNDGLAMPTAIDRWICVTACRSLNKSSSIHSLNYNEGIKIISHSIKFSLLFS